MDPTTVLFAIEAGVKIGKKISDVLVDSTQERPLLLPVGDILSITFADAQAFFARPSNRHLHYSGGPYHDLSDDELVKAYLTIMGISARLGNDETSAKEAVEIVSNLHKFEQFKEGYGARPAIQRLLGTVVEIGIDFFIANPQAMGRDSSARQILHAFMIGLDETEFAEEDWGDIAGDVLVAGLKVFGDNTSLVSSDERIQILLGGVTEALIEDIKEVPTEAAWDRRRELFKRITSSMLRGAAGSFAENAEIFIAGDSVSKKIIRSTITQLFRGLEGKEEVFTNESLELLVKSALNAVSENAELITDEIIIQKLIGRSVKALTEIENGELFSETAIAAILRSALEILSENSETLIDPSDPGRQFVADAVAAMAEGLASNLGSGKFKDLFSTKQLIELAQIVFNEVARHPEHLLGDSVDEPGKTALAQIIASVASALGDDPGKLTDGRGALEITRTALRVAVQNMDKLLDMDLEDPSTNLLYQALNELVTAVLEVEDPRRLLTREVFLEIAGRVLSTVSANVCSALDDPQSTLIADAVSAAMELANGTLENHINGANLPVLIEHLLREVLCGQLNLDDANAVAAIAGEALRAA